MYNSQLPPPPPNPYGEQQKQAENNAPISAYHQDMPQFTPKGAYIYGVNGNSALQCVGKMDSIQVDCEYCKTKTMTSTKCLLRSRIWWSCCQC